MTGHNRQRELRPALVTTAGDDPDFWGALPAEQDEITFTRSQYDLIRVAANARIVEIGRRNRQAASAARASGRPGARVAAASTPAAEVRTDEYGRMTYRGASVQMSSAGEPCVFTAQGWMQLSAFAASDADEDTLVTGKVLASMQGTRSERLFREGPA
jgi:hypothetical protein